MRSDSSSTGLRVLAAPVLLLSFGLLAYGLFTENVLAENIRLWVPAAVFDMAFGMTLYALAALACLLVPALRRRRRVLAAILLFFLGAAVVGIGTVLGVLTLMLAIYGTGRLFWPPPPSCTHTSFDPDGALVASCVGITLWAVGGWGLFHFPINSSLLYAGIVCAVIVLRRCVVADLLRETGRWLFDPAQAEGAAGSYLMWAGSFFFVCFGFLLALFPTVGFDAMAQHQRFLNFIWFNGFWDFSVARNGLQIMPGYMENYFYAIAGFMGGGEGAGRLAHGLLFLLTCAGLALVMRRFGQDIFAPAAVAALASSPMVLQVLGTLHAEIAMMLSVVCIVVVCRAMGTERLSFRAMVGVGICLLFPVLLKVNGVVISAVGALGVMFLLWRHNRTFFLKGVAGCAAGAAVGAPLFFTAYWMTGNPIYPLYNQIFKSPFFPFHMSFPSRFMGRLSWDMLYGMTFHSGDYCEMGPGGMGFHYLVLVPLALLAPLLICRRALLAWAICFAYALAVLVNAQYIRYLVPIAPLIILLGLGAVSVCTSNRFLRGVFCALLLLLCGLNLLSAPSGFVEMREIPPRWLFTQHGQDAIVRKKAPVRLLGRQINAMDGGRAVAAFLGYPGGCDVTGTVYYNVELYSYPFHHDLLSVRTVDDMRSLASKFKLGHVVVRNSRYSDRNSRIVLDALSVLAKNRLKFGDYEWFIL